MLHTLFGVLHTLEHLRVLFCTCGMQILLYFLLWCSETPSCERHLDKRNSSYIFYGAPKHLHANDAHMPGIVTQ